MHAITARHPKTWAKQSGQRFLCSWAASCPVQAALYPKVHDLTYPLPKLDMRVHCLHGTGMDTAEHFTYDVPRFSDSAPPAPSHVRQGPGDGTVNLRSLEAGRRYADSFLQAWDLSDARCCYAPFPASLVAGSPCILKSRL